MKNSKKILYRLFGTLTVSALVFTGTFISFQFKQSTNAAEIETNSESPTELITESQQETLSTFTSTSLSYVEQVELDYVAQPEKRTPEEAVVKLKELSRWYPALYFVAKNADQYPDELLKSGAGNPEMTAYLYEYLTSDSSATGGFTDEEQPENHPLFLQFDPRWGYMPYGNAGPLGGTGCGPTCLSMVVFYLTGDRTCTPDAIAQYSLDNGHYVPGAGTAWSLLTDYPKEHNLSSRQISLREANLKAELDKGHYLICSVRKGNFTSTGHFIVIYGYDENGFKINDPKCVYRSRLPWTYQQIKNDIKATWSIGY